MDGDSTSIGATGGAEKPARRLSARQRRAMSAIPRPGTAARRPMTASRRPYSAYTRREGESENMPKYDAPESNREWWRYYMKETPIPGSYQVGGFLDELKRNPNSYRFRDSSRAKSASHQRFTKTGEMLIPGAYETVDFVQESGKKAATYGFKRIEREQGPKIGHGYGDKDMDVSPNMYSVVDYAPGASNRGTKTNHFKSHVDRDIALAHQFPIVKGPGPGMYESQASRSTSVSSSFKSKVPRFDARPSKVPGPGSYSHNDSVFGMPKPVPAAALQHMKKRHGITI